MRFVFLSMLGTTMLSIVNRPGCGIILHQPTYPKELLKEDR